MDEIYNFIETDTPGVYSDGTNTLILREDTALLNGEEYVLTKISDTEYSLYNSMYNGTFTITHHAKFYKDDHSSYATEQEGVATSLEQRLSVIKGELWYQINFGLPLLDKYKSKSIFDTTILDIITSHRGVKQVISFESSVKEHVYYFNCKILSIFNAEFELSNNYVL